jgi:hypothetical protein
MPPAIKNFQYVLVMPLPQAIENFLLLMMLIARHLPVAYIGLFLFLGRADHAISNPLQST